MSESFLQCDTEREYGEVFVSEFPTPVDGKNGDFNGWWVPNGGGANGKDILVKNKGSNEFLCYNGARFLITDSQTVCRQADSTGKSSALAYAKKEGSDVEGVEEWKYKVGGKEKSTKDAEFKECDAGSLVDLGADSYEDCGDGLFIYNFGANQYLNGEYVGIPTGESNGYPVVVKNKLTGLPGNTWVCFNGKYWMITDDWRDNCDADDKTVQANALWYAKEKDPEDVETWTSPSGQTSTGYISVCSEFRTAAAFEVGEESNINNNDGGMPMAGIIAVILMAVVVIAGAVIGVICVRKKTRMAKANAGLGDESDEDEEEENNVEMNNTATQVDEETLVAN